jgi:hypothetical protein
MPQHSGRLVMLLKALSCAAGGALVGLVVGYATDWIPSLEEPPAPLEYPLPYHVPKYPGGVSLRLAMVHDVLHERFPRHGEAYYRERERRVRQALRGRADKPDGRRDDAYFALLDDLGAGLDFCKEHDEAVRVLRDKLREQQAQGLGGKHLYTTYANLGTFLIHGNFARVVAGDAAARQRLREGLDFIHKAIEVNPGAHFGREVWQAVAVEFLLEALDNPRLLLTYDMVGNRLDKTLPLPNGRTFDAFEWGMTGMNRDAAEYLQGHRSYLDPAWYRRSITRVGAEEGWKEAVRTSHDKPVPFDEPALGVVGMWRLGGGANPHFALALGEIMWRVGQRYIAWCAYERAARMAGRFWPDADLCRKLTGHCRARQASIEGELPGEEVARLRPRFEDELAHGREYQQAYQDYEARRIRAGASLDDPRFHDAFFEGHGGIASPPGPAERFVVRPGRVPRPNLPAVVFGAGLFAFGGACLVRRRSGPRQQRADTPCGAERGEG